MKTKNFRIGIMKYDFEFLPSVRVVRYGTLFPQGLMDVCFSWLCFFASTRNYDKYVDGL